MRKNGAGQHFTPRVLMVVMTKLIKPQPGERCNAPTCGTFGFMISAGQYSLVDRPIVRFRCRFGKI